MELLPYDKFVRLRLGDFNPSATDARDLGGSACFEFLDLYWFDESCRGVEFLRHEDDPTRLGAICVDLRYTSTELGASILTAVSLPLRAGMSRDEVNRVLGEHMAESTGAPGYIIREFECGSSDRYRITGYFTEADGLHGVDVVRADLVQHS